ncbi:MAG TPA: hypothetical protein VHR66_18155 [Gemmataceae bacterium]|nr:hypothetical protein [Gemmataceae bacterium]
MLHQVRAVGDASASEYFAQSGREVWTQLFPDHQDRVAADGVRPRLVGGLGADSEHLDPVSVAEDGSGRPVHPALNLGADEGNDSQYGDDDEAWHQPSSYSHFDASMTHVAPLWLSVV